VSSQYEDSVQRIVALMKDTFADKFKTYYDGDPEAIPLFNLPCIIVTQTDDETEADSWQQDEVVDELTIKVVLNKQDDYDNDKVNPLNMTERKIRNFIKERDPLTGHYLPGTIKGALRTTKLEGVTDLAPSIKVSFGINPRPAGDGLAKLTAEGHVKFSISYPVDIPITEES
jgi:hypothetical protein